MHRHSARLRTWFALLSLRARTRAATSLAIALVAACGAPLLTMEPGARAFTPEDYEDVYSRWTRSARPYDFGRLATILNVTGTFESREFRWAYVVRYGYDFGLSTEARNALLAESLRRLRQLDRPRKVRIG